MYKTLSQNNYLNTLKFKINLKEKLIKTELISLILNDNKIINNINTSFNVFTLNVFNLKTYQIKNIIVNPYLNFFSI